MHDSVVTFRPVIPADEEFLLEVYASTREEELSQLPWDESQRTTFLRMQFAAQQQDYQRRFPDADYWLILLDDKPIGRQYLARSKDELRILDIAIVPGHRRKGIGTRLLTGLLDEAIQMQQVVRVYVERFNPALGLFERLGFVRGADIGSHFLLEWKGRN